MERITPNSLNYDNILPLAIESRSNRREFRANNGQTFSPLNTNHIRIDINADSMLDAVNSYLEVDITNGGGANSFLGLAPFGPAFIQRLRIESGGVVIEDIDEYSRLYAMTSLCQCPAEYLKKNYNNMGMYQRLTSGVSQKGDNAGLECRSHGSGNVGTIVAGDAAAVIASSNACRGSNSDDLIYPPSLQGAQAGSTTVGVIAGGALNRATANGLLNHCKIPNGGKQTLCIPLLSGFLNMDKYIPLIMMNAGFTLDIELVSNDKIGTTTTENADAVVQASVYTVDNVKYVAHLIDLDRSFYDKLRAVMDSTGGVLQLAGQTYRHYTGQLPIGATEHTITLPARVKSVKSIFATFHGALNYGIQAGGYSQSVFQNANISDFRFEIGSVRYPQTNVKCKATGSDAGDTAAQVAEQLEVDTEFLVELQKAFGKLGDYQHQTAFSKKNLSNVDIPMTGLSQGLMPVSSYVLGFDFEAFQRVALEAGINTADRSLPINFICNKHRATVAPTRADFYVLTDAIYYISLDGTVSVSV